MRVAGTVAKRAAFVSGQKISGAIKKVRSSLRSPTPVSESKIWKFTKPKAKKTKSSTGYVPIVKGIKKKSLQKSSVQKSSSTPKTKEAEPKKIEKQEDISSIITKYREAAKRHAVSTGTNVKVFDTKSGKHVERNMKDMLGAEKEKLAKKIRAAGGEVPNVEAPKKLERDPNRKPPPALAEEGLLDKLPGYKSSAEEFKKDAEDAKKHGTGSTFKKFLKKSPKALGGIAPGKGLVAKGITAGAAALAGKRGAGAAVKGALGKFAKKVPMKGKLGAAAAGAASAKGLSSSSDSSNKKPSVVDTETSRTNYGGNRSFTSIERKGQVDVSASAARRSKKLNAISGGTTPDVHESHLSQIKSLVESDAPSLDLTFGEHQISINNRIGKKLLTVYESLNKENKQKVAKMLDESVDSFRKVINFVVRQ